MTQLLTFLAQQDYPFAQYQQEASTPIWETNGFWFVMGMLTIVVIAPLLKKWVHDQTRETH